MFKNFIFFGAIALLFCYGCSEAVDQYSVTPPPAAIDEAGTDQVISTTAEKVVTILVSLENGQVVYSDSNNQDDEGLVTHAGYGTQVIWKLDPQSGLKAIENVTLAGDLFMLAELPSKVGEDTWVARVGSRGKGEASYKVEVNYGDNPPVVLKNANCDPLPPFLRMP